jgi:MFS family permease
MAADFVVEPGAAKPAIPPVIRRNTILIAASQVCSGMGIGLLPTLGALMVYKMVGSMALAGTATVIQGIARLLVAYPTGLIADRYGRKPAMVAGLVVAAAGAVVVGTSVAINSFPLLLFGVLVFAMATGGSMQLRVAATDMYPPSRRAEGLGYVLTGSVFGSVGKAGLISFASIVAVSLSVDPMALAWWLVPVVVFPALLLVLQIHPDPKDIALNLEQYYPDYKRPAPSARPQPRGNFRTYVKDPSMLTVFISNFSAQGNMSMIMVVAALSLSHHGHDLPAIAFSSMLHSLGMNAFSIPIGWLTDRVGRRPIMLSGLVIAAVGTMLIALTGDYWILTLGFFLVGFGWSGVNVAGTVLLADLSPAAERARVIGTNDTFAGAANMLLALIAGPVMDWAGVEAIGIVGVALMIVPMFMVLRLSDPRGLPLAAAAPAH